MCLHFQDDRQLKNTLILNTEWATEAVYKIFDDNPIKTQHGHFTDHDIDRIWCEQAEQHMASDLLQLMKRFSLCYDLPETGHYIAPQLLPADRPEDFEWQTKDNLTVRYQYRFMPKGILSRLIVALHDKIEADRRRAWKYGTVFQHHDGTRAQATENPESKTLELRLVGQDKRDFLAVLMHEIDKINASFAKIQYDTLIPCLCKPFKDNPEFFKHDELKDFAKDNAEIQCRKCRQMVDAKELLEGVLKRGGEIKKAKAKLKHDLSFPEKVELKRKIKQCFDRECIVSFYEELDIKLKELDAKSDSELTSDLIKHAINQTKLPELLKLIRQCRPEDDWEH